MQPYRVAKRLHEHQHRSAHDRWTRQKYRNPKKHGKAGELVNFTNVINRCGLRFKRGFSKHIDVWIKRQRQHENRSVNVHKLQPKAENLMKISTVIHNPDVAKAKYISRNRKRKDEGIFKEF